LNPLARLEVYGQELNAEDLRGLPLGSHAQGSALRPHRGNSFVDDTFGRRTFDYLLANPPFGVEWKKVEKAVRDEHPDKGLGGRFGAGLPRINDGSFLFMQHMIKHMKPAEQADPGPRSSSTAHPCSPAPPAPANPRSADILSRTTNWRRLSHCPISSSTTPASPPTSGW